MIEPEDLNESGLRDRAVAAARGDAPFDLLIQGATVADVATGELRAADVGITGPLIASVHAPDMLNRALEVLKAADMILAPGLIDSHMHIESSMVVPSTYAGTVLPRGVTTVVWDPHEFANVAGLAGMEYAIAEAKASPLRILTLAPSCVPSAPGYETSAADFTPEVACDLLARMGVVGLAEVMDMSGVVERRERMRGILQAGLESRKPVFGHARGLSGAALQAYAAAGVGSDHELTSASDLIEKLRAGLTIELRGSHPHLLPEFAEALQALPAFPPTLTLCTDDVFPDDLLSKGGLDEVLRLLVRHGLEPLRALQAATLNAAIRLGRRDLGLVAPGCRADLVLFRDLNDFESVHVFRNGKLPTYGCQSSATLPRKPLLQELAPADFEIPARGPVARVATIDRPRFTQWGERRIPVKGGNLSPPKDVTRIGVVHRHGRANAKPRLGFLTGWGKWDGAFATTVSHDSHNLTVFGNEPAEMAEAANAVIGTGGGMAVVHAGRVAAHLPLPVGGLVSGKSLSSVAARFGEIRDSMDSVVDWEPPHLVFKALVGATLACNPGPRQTDLGIADPHAGQLLESPVLEDGIDA